MKHCQKNKIHYEIRGQGGLIVFNNNLTITKQSVTGRRPKKKNFAGMLTFPIRKDVIKAVCGIIIILITDKGSTLSFCFYFCVLQVKTGIIAWISPV